MRKICLFIVLFLAEIWCSRVVAQEVNTLTSTPDSIRFLCPDTLSKKKSFKKWLKSNFLGSEKSANRPFDYTLVVGPFYNPASSFCIAFGILGMYSWDRADKNVQKSQVSAVGQVSVKGMITLNLTGKNYFKHDIFRWQYQLKWQRQSINLWGIGYDAGRYFNEEKFTRSRVFLNTEGLARVYGSLFLGLRLNLDHTDAANLSDVSRINYQSRRVLAVGLGPTIQYDSRDNSINATRGIYARLDHLFYPNLINTLPFSCTDASLALYHPLWNGAVGAFEAHGLLSFGNTIPWNMMAQVAETDTRMRGYYEGRYRDRNLLEAQIELRQHVWKSLGVALFVGCANVFPKFSKIQMKHTLPNAGIGLRYKFKSTVIRLDLGFTKHKPGVVFNVNEAF